MASPPDSKASGGRGLRPQTPVCDTFERHKLSQNVSKVRYLLFSTIKLSPLSLQNRGLSANRQRFQIFHPTISLSHEKLLFWKFLMTSLHVICGLGPPAKNSGYA